jgi:catechol 2,3-dioxygenase-like lactoylglutathione lyase family enzyme
MPRVLNHIAVSVTDIFQAMRWYREVLGMSVLAEPVTVSAASIERTTESKKADHGQPTADSNHLSNVVREIFGTQLGKFMICHLVSSSGVGIELFEFIEPAAQRREGSSNFEYWKTGFFHLAITEHNVETLAQRIGSSGGKIRTGIIEVFPGTGKKICFCEDPFGNIIEIYSHSYEEFWGSDARGQQEK